ARAARNVANPVAVQIPTRGPRGSGRARRARGSGRPCGSGRARLAGRARRPRGTGRARRTGGARGPGWPRGSGRAGGAGCARGPGRPRGSGRTRRASRTVGARRPRGTGSARSTGRARGARLARAVSRRAREVAVLVLVVGAGGDVADPVAVQVPTRGPLRSGGARRPRRANGTVEAKAQADHVSDLLALGVHASYIEAKVVASRRETVGRRELREESRDVDFLDVVRGARHVLSDGGIRYGVGVLALGICGDRETQGAINGLADPGNEHQFPGQAGRARVRG